MVDAWKMAYNVLIGHMQDQRAKETTMNAIKATIRNGRIETDKPLNLPDGTQLIIPLPSQISDDDEGWDNSPAGIVAWLKWYDSLQPLIFTEQERAALESDRQARKEWEKAHFDERAEDLRGRWQ